LSLRLTIIRMFRGASRRHYGFKGRAPAMGQRY
jgi:hypothetical protein